MKRFIYKGVFFVLILLITDVVVGKIFFSLHQSAFRRAPHSMSTEYAMYSVNSDVIIIGSSRANHHYVPEILANNLHQTVYNCGKDGSPFLYQCCLVDGIMTRTVPRMFIWEIEPTCLSATPLGIDFRRLSDLNPFYEDNDCCKTMIDRSQSTEKYKMLSRMYRYNSRALAYIYKYIAGSNYSFDGYIPLANDGYEYPVLTKMEEDDYYSEELAEYFIDIIRKCKAKKIDLVLSFSPRFVRSNYAETQAYQQLMRIVEKEHIPLIDLYNDTVFLNDSTLFKDKGHLNDRGARLFSEKWMKLYDSFNMSFPVKPEISDLINHANQ